jgi:hypothetical protein
MTPRETTTPMLTPQHLFDGALLATGTALSVSVNPSIAAAVAGAAVSGVFICLAKALELYIRDRRDKRAQQQAQRIKDLEGWISQLSPVDPEHLQ